MTEWDELSDAERRAVTFVRLLIDIYGGQDGTGLFRGVARYGVLESRLRLAAVQGRSLMDTLTHTMRLMRWPVGPSRHDAALIAAVTAEAAEDAATRAVLRDRTALVIILARHQREVSRAARGVANDVPRDDDPPTTAQSDAAAAEFDDEVKDLFGGDT